MSPRYAVLLLAAALAVPAAAQSGDGYDPGRTCRTYVMQKLPVPVHCMAELMGNWSTNPYIDGDFMFRNREEWLLWRDREDYRHWKNHDFAWHAGMPSTPLPPPPPSSAPVPPPPPSAQAGAALMCPAEVPVRLVLDRGALQGWSGNDSTAMLRLEPQARVEGSLLYCSYGPGHITISRPAWGRCVVRPDGLGFDCTP